MRRKDPHLTFKTNPCRVQFLKEMGLSVATLANNHITDYGQDGVKSTILNLTRAGIISTGAGNNVFEATTPAILSDDSSQIAVLAFNAFVPFSKKATRRNGGTAWFDLETTQAAILNSEKQAAGIIICVHWGIDYYEYPIPIFINRAKFLFENHPKILAFVGHHPHLQQPVVFYKGKPIFSSLGNFLFDEPFMLSRIGSVLKLTIHHNEIKDYSINFTSLDEGFNLGKCNGSSLVIEKARLDGISINLEEGALAYSSMNSKWIRYLIYQFIRYQDFRSMSFLLDYYSPKELINQLFKP